MTKFRFGIVLLASLFVLAPGMADAKDNAYVGVKKCGKCHEKELYGNQVESWRKGPHAGAMETLDSEQSAEVTKRLGIAGSPREAAECLECHVTAHGVDSRLIKYDIDPANGVGCESCHGPGSNYRKKSVMSDHDKSVAKGLVEQSEKACIVCHNDRSPTFDAAAGFDYATAKEQIAHPTPADVRGRIVEIEKENKKK